jgi:hypothetical protein
MNSLNNHLLFHLGHPAHYHIFKNPIKSLLQKGFRISIVIKKKDILESLLKHDGLPYKNLLPGGRSDSKAGILLGMIKTDFNLLQHCLKDRPGLMIGTSYAISHVGKLLNIPSININEDDWDAVPIYAKFSYPWASVILSPEACSNGKWEKKSIKYRGYHELAYLHPDNFSAELAIASKYIDISKKYFMLRFSHLKAHHDKGVQGISDHYARKLIGLLEPHGNVYITSERPLQPDLEHYRMQINPLDIHHVTAYASLFIGDSQTMACEAGVLGVPFIRYTDFVGRLGYLNELEQIYQLGFGFKSHQFEEMLGKANELISAGDLAQEWENRRQHMLADKINVNKFLVWFIETYPDSARIMWEDPDYQYRFK